MFSYDHVATGAAGQVAYNTGLYIHALFHATQYIMENNPRKSSMIPFEGRDCMDGDNYNWVGV
ncbi:MAG: hypothetical protein WCN95_16070, partial [bacterium]